MDTENRKRFKAYIQKAEQYIKQRAEHRKKVKGLKFDTIAVHGMYSAETSFNEGLGGIIEPVFMSTSQSYRDSDEMEAGLSYQIPTWCYSRIHNPTNFYLEEILALLECYNTPFDATALATSSGMSAIKQAVEPFLDHFGSEGGSINFVSASQVYGGTFQLFNLRMRERAAHVRWVTKPWDNTEWEKLIDENTRFLYAEMPSNPQQACFDIKTIAELAHTHNIPLIVDSTVATPALVRPIEHGADIVVQSLTKTIGSGGASIGGAIIARHDIISRHLADEIKKDYCLWLKLWPFRDSGPCMHPFSAFYFLNEVRSLRMKVKLFCDNSLKVANFLKEHPNVDKVDYLGLEDHPLHELASKYMRLADTDEKAFGHLMSFYIKGGAKETRRAFDNLQRTFRATDLGRIKSVATIPAISTHSQQGEEGRKLAGIPENLVRLCVGAEHYQDIIDDLDQALNKIH